MIKTDADRFIHTIFASTSQLPTLKRKYLINGNEPLLIEESSSSLLKLAKQHGFLEHHSITIDNKTNWADIFNLCEGLSLFAERRIISLSLPDPITSTVYENLLSLNQLINEDLLLILKYPKSAFPLEKNKWFKTFFNDDSVIINCQSPTRETLPAWINQRQKKLGLNLDKDAILDLCFHFEGNLLALSQILLQIQLLYGDKLITRLTLETLLYDASHFTPSHLIDAILAGTAKRAFHVLKQLEREEFEIIILIRSLQTELMQLIKIKTQEKIADHRVLFDKFNIWKNRRPLFTQALQRLSLNDLSSAVSKLAHIEIIAKSQGTDSLYREFTDIIVIMNGKTPLKAPRPFVLP